MNSNQAKQIPLSEILSRLGHEPIRKDKGGVEWVYKSPFRNEKEPSLFVNQRFNIWNDFGDTGGTVIDFVMRYENTNVKGALAFLDNMFSKGDFKTHRAIKSDLVTKDIFKQETLILKEIKPFKHQVLSNYLKGRAVNVVIAKDYLKVIKYHNSENDKDYFGAGLKNESGGYEIRNPIIKTCVGKKDISFIKGTGKGRGEHEKVITVFEGFIDFLSYLTSKNQNALSSDVMILNSASMVKRAKDFITKNDYQKVYTFFDNDKAGEKAQESFAELPNQIVSCNHLYQGFKDYNDYWQNHTKQLNR